MIWELPWHPIYRTAVVDFPWPVSKIKRDAYDWPGDDGMPYDVQRLADIQRFPFRNILHPEGAWVIIWTTEKYLPWVHSMMDLKYKVWDPDTGALLHEAVAPGSWRMRRMWDHIWRKLTKNGFTEGMKVPGNWPKMDGEAAVVAKFGNPPDLLTTKGLRKIIDGRRREHSQKPVEAYQQWARSFPGPRIDCFARERHPGFDAWGDHLPFLDHHPIWPDQNTEVSNV